MKPNTEGCTEWSCMYHGQDNRFKSAHKEGCPIRAYTGFVMEAFDPDNRVPKCTCDWRQK